jgi:hypothetical protein
VLSAVLNIRDMPSLNGTVVGKMPRGWTVYVEGVVAGGGGHWARSGSSFCAIKLGSVEYMRKEEI